jgi:hypothetical protein
LKFFRPVYTQRGEKLQGYAVKTAKTFAVVIAESIHISIIHYTTTPPTWGVVDFRKMRKMRARALPTRREMSRRERTAAQ